MRVLVLTKRQYMGMDLLDDRFGRFRELPLELARLGHEVNGLAVSYRPRYIGTTGDRDASHDGIVTWHSTNATDGMLPRLDRVFREAFRLVREFKPDVIWAASDAYIATFGAWLAKRLQTCCVIDLYDNFESFGASKLPGLLPLFRRAVRDSDGVTSFSERMTARVIHFYQRTKPVATIESGQRDDLFYPQNRDACRLKLGLPQGATIVGTAGALEHSRGIETLFSAFRLLEKKNNDLYLAIAGPRKPSLNIPKSSKILDFKKLPHETVPLFVNALDVAVICYKQSPKGDVSFPQKAYEIIACRVPLAAAAVGCMKELLADYPECLYEPEIPASLAQAIERQLETRTVANIPVPSWGDSARKLEQFFLTVLANRAQISEAGTCV